MSLDGEYIVYFKPPNVEKRDFYKIRIFIGECVNFVENGTCAFKNENEILLVQTNDILQMRRNKNRRISDGKPKINEWWVVYFINPYEWFT